MSPVGNVGKLNLLNGLLDNNAKAALTQTSVTTSGTATTWTGTLTCDSPVEVTLAINVTGLNAATTPPVATDTIDFRGETSVAPSTIPPPPANDVNGPVVVQVIPPNNGFVGEDEEITITFNKPIDSAVSTLLAGISLSGGPPGAATPIPILRLDPSQQVLLIQYPGLPPGANYHLTLSGQSIRDLAGHPLNEQPGISTPVSFTTTFRTARRATEPIPLANGSSGNGRGAVISGNQLYVLDQGPKQSYLEAFDITSPAKPVLESQLALIGQPRDLVVIPQYEYVTNLDQTEPYYTNDLVAVVGGDLTLQTSSVQGSGTLAEGTTTSDTGQYLWVVSMEDPTDPQVLASPIVTYRVGSVVPKIVWSPPNLIYEEYLGRTLSNWSMSICRC